MSYREGFQIGIYPTTAVIINETTYETLVVICFILTGKQCSVKVAANGIAEVWLPLIGEEETLLKKECEVLKEELRIREMKKGLKKKQFIYWLGEVFFFFSGEQTTKEGVYSPFLRNQALIIARNSAMQRKNLISEFGHFLQISY